ncbi:MAG: hypothetical protein Q9190_005994, partial [Brigantiaea leucoxantha]
MWNIRPDLADPHYLRPIVENYMRPSIQSIADARHGEHGKLAKTAVALILFFTGCLQLYVPDRPFDPALSTVVKRDRHRRRKEELRNRLKALRLFQNALTGQDTSVRSVFIEEELRGLSVEPQGPTVVRPNTSNLGPLQDDFSNVIQSIIMRLPDAATVERFLEEDHLMRLEVELLKSNIDQAYQRISNNDRVYDDITKPLIAMLEGLDAGLTMALLASNLKTNENCTLKRICHLTPFLGMSLGNSMRGKPDDIIKDCSSEVLDMRLTLIKSAGLSPGVLEQDVRRVHLVFQNIHSVYEDWKRQLGDNQSRNAARSSLYRYRGGDQEMDKADEEEFRGLFPDFESPQDREQPVDAKRSDPRVLSQTISKSLHQLVCKNENIAERIIELLQKASRDIAQVWKDESGMSCSSIEAQTALPAILLMLDESMEKLQCSSQTQKGYNFYAHPNLHEARKVTALTQQLQIRFEELHDAWPEQSMPIEILRSALEVLSMEHCDPLAKLLSKVEQLHKFVYEWETIASREFSAANLYDQLTALLISWRRLELATWAQLLDMEDEKCDNDTRSWWFITYEVIVAAPLSLVDRGEELQIHAEQLFATLQEFILNTSMGQYSLRLQLLEDFRQYLRLIKQVIPQISNVYVMLSNFLCFYRRFEKQVREGLQAGRTSLEKDMKDVLLLASWKDANISALRESTKQSHQKLFKIVRKYRALLAQPITALLAQDFAQKPESFPIVDKIIREIAPCALDTQALHTCRQHLHNWPTRPSRLVNVDKTADYMERMALLPSVIDENVSYLSGFASELVENMQALRKATPSTLTPENEESIKHLKVRKRKLLSDTLKELRHMGFRTNMNTDLLARQASLSTILAKSPTLPDSREGQSIQNAELYFHQVLQKMPEIRKSAQNHSEDLVQREIDRGIGYIESILSVLIKQRVVVIDTLSAFEDLKNTIEVMENAWKPSIYDIQALNPSLFCDLTESETAVHWLPSIIEIGCILIEKHGKLGSIDHSDVLNNLQSWKRRMEATKISLGGLPKLPEGLASELHLNTHQNMEVQLSEFRESLQQWIEQQPLVAFILVQIELWVRTTRSEKGDHVDGVRKITPVELDQTISKVSDSILVVCQRLPDKIASITSSDDKSWLILQDTGLSDSLKSLRLSGIAASLQDATSSIQQLHVQSSTNLNLGGA